MTSTTRSSMCAALGLAWILLAACGSQANGVAEAGPAQDVAIGQAVVLDGSGSSDPEGHALAYAWKQVHGPDVTGGAGTFSGAQPTFTAPESASTLVFELRVHDGNGLGAPDRVQIHVLENPAAALFVDGDVGNDDAGDGTRAAPYATIRKALAAAQGEDVYVRARANGAVYDETGATLIVPPGTSLYGGYGEGWVRDTAISRTRVAGHSNAFVFYSVVGPTWFSGFGVTASGSPSAGVDVRAIEVNGGQGPVVIEDNVLVAGDVGPGTADPPASSYGVLVVGHVGGLALRHNEITAGRGGDGAAGIRGHDGGAGADGSRNDGQEGGAGGSGAPAGFAGGDGGRSGGAFYSNGEWGRNGGGMAGVAPCDLSSPAWSCGGAGG